MSVVLRRAALAYLIVWQLSPPLAYGAGWRFLAVLAMLLWLALDTLAARSVLRRPNWPVLGGAAFVLYTVFVEWLVPDSASISRQFQIWIMFFFLLVGESQQRGRSDEARFCFWVILLVLPIWSIATLWGINTIGGDVSRTIARSSEEARELVGQGIGGFGFVYTLVLCIPFLVHLAFRSGVYSVMRQPRWKVRASRLLILGNLLLAALVVLRAGYTIALILAAFAILCVLLIRSRRSRSLAISLCFVTLLVSLAGILINPALRSLESVAAGTEYSAKVRDVRASLEDDSSTGTVHDRTERYSRSLRLFGENPIIGTLTFDDVGKHSAVLDRFAQYGAVFGLLFLALLMFVPIRYLRSRQVPIGLSLSFLVVAIGFPMLNNVFMSWGLILYVFSRGAFVVMGIPLERSRQPMGQVRAAHA
ncbi:O-antigen ligase family protein [Thermomonas sp.]|uniref:O-antigen ligase family protein n=1 Tax=Thermomonas sp. TaxID=1971895 RepID=UPI0035AD89DE